LSVSWVYDLCFCKGKDGSTALHLVAQIGIMQTIDNGILSPDIWDENDDSDEEEEDSEDEVDREDMVSSTIYKGRSLWAAKERVTPVPD